MSTTLKLRSDVSKYGIEFNEKQSKPGVGDMSFGYDPEFESVANRVAKLVTTMLDEDHHISTMISGWRHGYSASAVARYVLGTKTLLHPIVFFGCNGYREMALTQIRREMHIAGWHWGRGYNYCPSYDELTTPPALVQRDINKRLASVRKLAIADNNNLCNTVPYLVFNDPIENAGVVRHDGEVEPITEFIAAVKVEMDKYIGLVFERV